MSWRAGTCAAAIAAAAAPALAVAGEGPTASIAAALGRGDVAALQQITLGSIYSRLTDEERAQGAVRMTAADLVALTRGCVAEDPVEPGGVSGPRAFGMLGLRCDRRPVEGNRCEDVGYGLIIRPMEGYHRIEVWPNERWSMERCGLPHPPAPLPPPPPPPRKAMR